MNIKGKIVIILRYLAIVLMCYGNGSSPKASQHCCDCQDEEFLNLARQYPSVGYFSGLNGLSYGSGTFVDLEGGERKVVLTCAHIFDEVKDKEGIFFHIDGFCSKGKVIVHPEYQYFYKKHGFGITSYDIALFILEKPVEDPISPSKICFDLTHENRIGQSYISVGYGSTGHIFSSYNLRDGEKRASYAYALPKLNYCNDREEREIIIEHDEVNGYEVENELTYIVPGESDLNLSPFLTGPQIDRSFKVECAKKPLGVPGKGDSGGGIFSERNDLVGIISSGVENKSLAQNLIKDSYYKKHIKAIDAIKNEKMRIWRILGVPLHVVNDRINYQFKVVRDTDIPMVFQSSQDISVNNQDNDDKEESLYCTSYGTLLSFHKKWIFQTLMDTFPLDKEFDEEADADKDMYSLLGL